MTDLHLRILRLIANQRQRRLEDHDETDLTGDTASADHRRGLEQAAGRPKRTSRRPRHDGASHGGGAPGELDDSLEIDVNRVLRSRPGSWMCGADQRGFSASSPARGGRPAGRRPPPASQRPWPVCLSKRWTIGWVGAVVAWMLHVGALSLVQVSVVQAVISGGLVFLAVFAERFFGFRLGRRQWLGLAVMAAGLTVIGLTGGAPSEASPSSSAALIALQAGVFAASALLVVGAVKLDCFHQREGLLLAAAAGCLFGASDISVKFLTHAAADGLTGRNQSRRLRH